MDLRQSEVIGEGVLSLGTARGLAVDSNLARAVL
jgi:hypothetical protein